jgi:hypothetical protein
VGFTTYSQYCATLAYANGCSQKICSKLKDATKTVKRLVEVVEDVHS